MMPGSRRVSQVRWHDQSSPFGDHATCSDYRINTEKTLESAPLTLATRQAPASNEELVRPNLNRYER